MAERVPLTPDMAYALVLWHGQARSAFRRIVRLTSKGPERNNAAVLGLDDREIAAYFVSRYGVQTLHLFQDGFFVEELVASNEAARAKRLIEWPEEDASRGKGNAAGILDWTAPAARSLQSDQPAAPALVIPPSGVVWQLCDGAIARALVKECDARRNPERRRMLETLGARPRRWLPKAGPRLVKALRTLVADFPHFRAVIDLLVPELVLQWRLGGAVHLPPTLLLGPPGTGKTEFGRRLAEVLGMHFEFRSLAEATGGFLLTGTSRHWSESAPGVVARTLLECPEGKAPLLMLDELDKGRGDRRYPIETVLLGLLESCTAKAFRDENLDLEMDTRPMSYLLTANRMEDIRPEILSRLRIVNIAHPDKAQMPAVIRSIDRALHRDRPGLSKLFLPLSDDVVAALSDLAPRLVKLKLEESYGRALIDGGGPTQARAPRGASGFAAAHRSFPAQASCHVLAGLAGMGAVPLIAGCDGMPRILQACRRRWANQSPAPARSS